MWTCFMQWQQPFMEDLASCQRSGEWLKGGGKPVLKPGLFSWCTKSGRCAKGRQGWCSLICLCSSSAVWLCMAEVNIPAMLSLLRMAQRGWGKWAKEYLSRERKSGIFVCKINRWLNSRLLPSWSSRHCVCACLCMNSGIIMPSLLPLISACIFANV